MSGTLPQLKPVISPRNRRVVKITAFPRAGNVRSCLCSQKPGAATRRTDGNVLHTDNRDGFIPPRVNPGCGSGLRCVCCALCVVRAAERVSQGKGLVCSSVSPAASTTGGFICVIAQWEPNTTWVSSASLFWDSRLSSRTLSIINTCAGQEVRLYWCSANRRYASECVILHRFRIPRRRAASYTSQARLKPLIMRLMPPYVL